MVRELGQPSVQVDVDREKIARYGINVSDVEGVVQAGVGGQAATQVIQGERLFDLVVRMKPEYRSSTKEIGNLLVPTPSGQQVPISELATISQGNGASFIYRSANSRYIGVPASRAATWRAPWTKRRKPCDSPCRCRQATRSIGAASTANTLPHGRNSPSSDRSRFS